MKITLSYDNHREYMKIAPIIALIEQEPGLKIKRKYKKLDDNKVRNYIYICQAK